MKEVTLGIDIGGTNTKLGLVDREGNCLVSSSIETYADKPVEVFMTLLFKAIDQLKAQVKEPFEIKAVGIGAPNGNYYTGTIENAANLHGWGDYVPLAELVKDKLNLPVAVTNDANAAALGEMKFGVAKGMKNFMVITLGTGLGSGIIVNGDLLYGHDGFAGEFGHINVVHNGRKCGCGSKGCLETYVSATGLKRNMLEMIAEYNGGSQLDQTPFEHITSKMIFDAAESGDEIAQKAFQMTGEYLGKSLADAVAIFSPEAIVLFGGMAAAGDWILKPTQEAMDANTIRMFKGKTKLLFSNLKGDNTAILGSSALAWQELDKMVSAS
ncbi:ROK family protein [Limibacter armeniacum]|uniref:ROK family protein n=1 Tax=Limibacter armeniacum TaxID=466084 RepID=UPI002FE5921C